MLYLLGKKHNIVGEKFKISLTAFISREVFIQRAHSVGHIEFVLHVDSFHRAHAVTIGHIDEPPTRATGHEVTSARTDKHLSIQKK